MNRSFMNMFKNEPFNYEHVHKIGSLMNMLIEIGSLMNMYVKYNSSSHPFRRRPAGVVAFLHACQAKIS